MSRLVLLDGNAILHRAYHALPPMTAPDGTPSNAIYGFTSMLLKIASDLKPTHMAVAFDRPGPTFREKLFKKYQAQRPKLEDDFISQIEKVHTMVRAFHIPIFEMDGFEADDMIGTLATKARKEGMDTVIIVTGDRDILQLVEDDRIFVYMPTKGLSEAKLYGEKDVVERMGVTPTFVADLKALSGDSSDNYPGVAGIGPKTAVNLITRFGSVEKLYEALKKNDKRLNDISQGVLEKLRLGTRDAVLFKEIALIRKDVPLDADMTLCAVPTLDSPESREALSIFPSLLKRMIGRQSDTSAKGKKVEKPQETKTGEQQPLF